MKTKILALLVVLGCSGISWADRSGQEQLELVHQLQDKSVGYDGLKAGASDSAVLARSGLQETFLAMNDPSRHQPPKSLPEPAKTQKRKLTEGDKDNIELAAGIVAAIIAFFALPIMANFLTLAASAAIGVLAFYGARGLIRLHEKGQKPRMDPGDRIYF